MQCFTHFNLCKCWDETHTLAKQKDTTTHKLELSLFSKNHHKETVSATFQIGESEIY